MKPDIKARIYRFLKQKAVNLVILASSILLLGQSAGYPAMARTFPRLVLFMTIGLSLLDLLQTLIHTVKDTDGGPIMESRDHTPPNLSYGKSEKPLRRVCGAVVLMLVFIGLMQLLGFVAGSFVFLFLSARFLGIRNFKHLWISATVTTVFLYLVFIIIMKSILPQSYLWIKFIKG